MILQIFAAGFSSPPQQAHLALEVRRRRGGGHRVEQLRREQPPGAFVRALEHAPAPGLDPAFGNARPGSGATTWELPILKIQLDSGRGGPRGDRWRIP
eukprot:gene15204-biopygen9224